MKKTRKNVIFKIVIIFFAVFLCSFSLLAITIKVEKKLDVLSLTKDSDHYALGKYLQILNCNKNEISQKEILTKNISCKFEKNTVEVPNYGFSDSIYWIRFAINNKDLENEKWLLVLSYPHLDKIELFLKEQNGLKKIETAGDIYPFHKRKIKHRDFIFELNADYGKDKVYYMRFSGECAKQFPLSIWSYNSFITDLGIEKFGLGIYYGIMLVMIFYNLFIFASVRDKSYLFYVIYIFVYMLVQMSYNGLAFRYVWPEYPQWHSISLPFLIGASVFFMALFSKSFLNLKNFLPVFNYLLITIMGFSCGIILLSLLGSYIWSIKLAMVLMVLAAVTIMVSAVLCLKKGYRPARFFLTAWVAFLLGMILIALKTLGLLPSAFVTNYGIQIGSALEVTLLSLALADRINLLEQEKLDSQKMASLGNMASSIVHDLKNPLGIIKGYTEMAGDDSFEEDERIEFLDTVNREVDRLNDMVYDILDYSKGDIHLNIQQVNVEKYLMEINRYIEPYFTDKKIELKFHIIDKVVINIDPDRFRRVIYNIANNAADAMVKANTENASLDIEFLRGEDCSIINFIDNGPGIPKEIQDNLFIPFVSHGKNHGTGLGMAIVKNIVESHNGIISFVTPEKGGTVFKVTLNDG